MSKFVMECPNCGKYVEAKTGFFARKKIDCTCGYTIDVRTDKLTSRTCAHCGNDVVFDQSKGAAAKCPVCGQPINTMADQDKTVQFSCAQCGIRLNTSKSATTYICPVCDHVNDVVERLKTEEIKKDGLASIIKYEGDADTLVWKHPIEDFNLGSQLIVHESQEAIFFRDGQALDTFTAGRYTLEAQQLPILEKLYKLPTDTEGTFHSEVYYFNLIHQMAIKWGTPEKINFLEPMTGAPISIGARGVLNFKIANARKLLLKLVGTGGKLTRQDLIADGEGNIRNYFRSLIQLTVSTNLANIITGEKLDILQLDQQKMRLSASMLTALQASFEEYGLVITEFLIMGIMLPQKGDLGYDALQTILQMRQKDLTKSAIQTETEIKLAELEAKKQLDIVDIAISSRHTVGLKTDGTVVAIGDNQYGQCDVDSWRDIVSIYVIGRNTAGLRSDGTVVAVGNRADEIAGLRLFENFDNLELERETARIAQKKREEEARIAKEKEEEEARIAKEKEEAEQKLRKERRNEGKCQHCGGELKGLFTKKCTSCGRPKDY